MRHAARPALRIQGDGGDDAADRHLAAGRSDGAGQRAGEPLRAALHIAPAAEEKTSLRHREERPRQGGRIVVIIREVCGERAFDGFVVAENALEFLRQRQRPIALGDEIEVRARCEALHVGEHAVDAIAVLRKSIAQRPPRRVEIVRHRKRFAQRATAGLVKSAARNPLHRVQYAGADQRAMLGIAGVIRIAGFMQRALDEQVAGFVARCRAPDRVAALDDQHFASGACED